MSDTDEQRAALIEALIRERAHLEAHGKTDRVAEVDKELHRLGAAGETKAKRATKRAKAK